LRLSGNGRIAQGKLFEEIDALEQIYRKNPEKVVAVGECGLDFLIDRNDIYPENTLPADQVKNLQRQLFQAQIDLAKKLNLPLLVHCRDDRSKNPENSEAWDEVLEMVSDHPTILHCYSGLLPTTKKVLTSPTLVVSFAGSVTYPKNEYLREAVKLLSLDRIVLETDCPFLPPQSKRGTRNEPANIEEIAQAVADLKGISLEDVSYQTTENIKAILNQSFALSG
ncbi:MAG: TatD family hydrolase, partial [Patescibacteria group bacterium]